MLEPKMGDMGEMYRDWDAHKKQLKQSNYEWIMNLLTKNNIKFKDKNHGSHLHVWINEERIDVWPTTNKAKLGVKYHYNAYQLLLEKIKNLSDDMR